MLKEGAGTDVGSGKSEQQSPVVHEQHHPAITASGFSLQKLTRKLGFSFGSSDHQHEKAEVGIVFEPSVGRLRCRPDGSTVEEYDLIGPAIYVVPPFVLHHIEWVKPAESFCAHVEDCFWGGLGFAADLAKVAMGPVGLARGDLVVWEFATLLRHMWDEGGDEEPRHAVAGGLLKRAAKLICGVVADVATTVAGLTPRQREDMDAYIDRQLKFNLHTPDLAKLIGLSVPHFTIVLKETTGMTPHEYITKCRMQKALSLLSSGNYRLGEVASLVGYDDPQHFSRLFKRFFNYSPRDVILAGRGKAEICQ